MRHDKGCSALIESGTLIKDPGNTSSLPGFMQWYAQLASDREQNMQPTNVFEDFQRDICYRIFRCADGIALTATMKDVFHDIFIEVHVEPVSMRINSAMVNFLKHPTEHCPEIERAMAALVGTVIGKGMTRRLLELFGGGEGCGNIRTMLLGLLPLALNAKAAAGIKDQDEMLEKIRQELTGTCIGYPKAGQQ
jgi:hypothetical protein